MDIKDKKWSIFDGILLSFRASPVCMSVQMLLSLVKAFVPALEIGATAAFINTSLLILEKQRHLSLIAGPLACVVLLLVWNNTCDAAIDFAASYKEKKLRLMLQDCFVKKLSRLEFAVMENERDLDLINRVSAHPEEKVQEMYRSLIGCSTLLIQNISVLFIIISAAWWVGLLMFAAAVPLVLLARKSGQHAYQAQADVTKIKRKYEYYSQLLLDRTSVAERTLFSYSHSMNQRYQEAFQTSYKKESRVLGKWFLRMKAAGIVAALFAVFSTLLLLYPVLMGNLSVGLYISLVGTIFTLVNTITWNLSAEMESLAKNKETARELTMFCSLAEKEEICDTAPEEPFSLESLEFVDVWFRYPSTDSDILRGVSFRIEPGRHYAIVGSNGAGKTTLTKLLTGLYSNYSGKILLNGKELRGYSPARLQIIFSEVFQDFAKYSISVKENLYFERAQQTDDACAWQALHSVGLRESVSALPKSLETPLGKIEEGGIDLSGGQWQRLAMARALANPGEVTILDEPTAALDPLAESEVYAELQKICENKTTLFITHRLGSINSADIILVLNHGRVEQQGSHEALMKESGLYSEMYSSQQGWYL